MEKSLEKTKEKILCTKLIDLPRRTVSLLEEKAKAKRRKVKPYIEQVLEDHAEALWDDLELTGPTLGLLVKKAQAAGLDLKRYMEIVLTKHAENPVSR